MPFTYNDSLSDNISIVRFRIGDTQEGKGARPEERNFSDAEITAILTDSGDDVDGTTAALFSTLSSEWSRYAISFTMGPRKEELFRIAGRYDTKRKEWEEKSGTSSKSFSTGFTRRTNDYTRS